MIRQVGVLLIALVLLSQSILFGQTNQLPIYEDETAYEVYSAILSSPDEAARSKSKNFIIRQEIITSFGTLLNTNVDSSICLHPDAESEKIIGTAITDFIKVNKAKRQLQEKFKVEIPYKLISFEKILSIIKGGASEEGIYKWNEFYKEYPDSGGFIDLSAVGFNADKTVAVVSKAYWCGNFCGEGAYYVLQKRDGKWIPLKWKGEGCHWIS